MAHILSFTKEHSIKLFSLNSLFNAFLAVFMYWMLFILTGCQTEKDSQQTISLNYEQFLNPDSQFRSHPFYSLNDSLSPEEIKTQVTGFKDAGFGGFYLHSRSGLQTTYLGKDWWKAIDAATEQANKLGLQACYYDEDKWPSGYAGGVIPKMSEAYRAKCLVRLKKETPLPEGSVILKQDIDYNYIEYTAAMGNPTFNGTCWVDLFNPEMVQKFIEISYEPYVARYKKENNSFSIFSDESHIHARYFDSNTPNCGVLSYSPYVREKFKQLFGYDFLDKINLLFEEKDNWRQVRLQYYQAVALQFEESFTKQIAYFCSENGITYTGHFLGEDVLKKVRDRIGNSMLHYRNMQQPGIDHLGLSIDKRLMTAKSLSSVANQYNIQNRISEVFGISGQDMNFEDRKWIVGWHTILGINKFCPHLTAYSLKGARKRDYPPTFSYHQPYWKYNKIVEDYIARLSYITSVGQYQPQLLVIRPLESEFMKGHDDKEFTFDLLKVLEQLQAAHYDYDLGDEQIMCDTALVTHQALQIGSMTYKNVLLPDMISIRKSTVNLLLQLIQNGGQVFQSGRFPKYLDGIENTTALSSLKEKCIAVDTEKLTQQLPKYITPGVQITGKQSQQVWSMVRHTKKGNIIQLYNTSHKDIANFEINGDFLDNRLIVWEPGKAKCYELKADENHNYAISLAASSSIWLTSNLLSDEAQNIDPYLLSDKPDTIITLENHWKGKRLNPNVITLDFASYSVDNGKTFSKNEPVIGILERLNKQEYKGNVILKYQATFNTIPDTCKLVVETPDAFDEITFNKQTITINTGDYYLDHNFKTANIESFIKTGINIIEFHLQFEAANPISSKQKERIGSELESIYLIGNFAVKGNNPTELWETQKNSTGNFKKSPAYGFESFTIEKENSDFAHNLTLEGYPFYKGSFLLEQTFVMENMDETQQYYLNFDQCHATVFEVSINNQNLEPVCWSPYQIDITKALKEGDNHIQIKLTNSLRNLLGPHHQKRGEIVRVGPVSFGGKGGFPDPRGDANWYDKRLHKEPLKIWTDTYYCIPFGIENINISTTEKH